MNKTVAIYCGANTGNSKVILEQVHELIALLIQHNFDLVYGGGKTGLMGIIADQFLASGKKVIGVRPEKLIKEEDAHAGLTELIVVKGMHERKTKMMDLADVCIALPGGVGTLDEIIDVYTQVKIGFVEKVCGILNVEGHFDGLDILLKRMVETAFLKEADRQVLHIEESPAALMAAILK